MARTKASAAFISCLNLFVACIHLTECNSFTIPQLDSTCRLYRHGSIQRQQQPIDVAFLQRRRMRIPQGSSSSILSPAPSSSRTATTSSTITTTSLFMGDHSSATLFQVGDMVTVTEDVMKAGQNLKGRTGTVIETWEKCEVDPTCCCAEWVDEGLSVHVKFQVEENENEEAALFANDTFIHYFAESELIKKKEEDDEAPSPVAFDGMSCKAFKLDKLSMGEQAKRIAAFEESRKKET